MAWYNSSWTKRQPIVLTGTGVAQSDYQVRLAVTFDSDMKSDFSDLRFTKADGTTLLDAWLESKTDSTSAVVWVETNTPANTVEADIFMYYGNAGAASDWDFDETFIFGDPFDNSTLNTTRWTATHDNPVYNINTVNHYLEVTDIDSNWEGNSGFEGKIITLPSDEYIIEDAYSTDGFLIYSSLSESSLYSIFMNLCDTTFTNMGVVFVGARDGWTGSSGRNEGGVGGNLDYSTSVGAQPASSYWYIYKTGGDIYIKENNIVRHNETNNDTPNRVYLNTTKHSSYPYSTQRFGAFKIRKYAANPPTYQFGAEQSESGWSGKIIDVTNPAKVFGIAIGNISKIMGI